MWENHESAIRGKKRDFEEVYLSLLLNSLYCFHLMAVDIAVESNWWKVRKVVRNSWKICANIKTKAFKQRNPAPIKEREEKVKKEVGIQFAWKV